MTSPNKNGAGSATDPTTATLEPPAESSSTMTILEHSQQVGRQLNGLPTAHAAAYPPHRGRGRHLLIVASCPHCSAAHALRPADLAATVDRRCPVTGSRYAALVDLTGVPDVA